MNEERMQLWKERLATNEAAYSGELGKMDHREEMFRGKYKFKEFTARVIIRRLSAPSSTTEQ